MKTVEAHALFDGKKRIVNSAEGIDFYFENFKEFCKVVGYEPKDFDFFYFAYCLGNSVSLKEKMCVLKETKTIIDNTFYGENYDVPLAQGRKERV